MTAPSAWSASAGVLHQTSNIHDGDVAAATLPKVGSSVWWAAGPMWMDGTLELTLRAGDDDALGVMFRYQDTDNYYRFWWDQQRRYCRLVNRTNGVRLGGGAVTADDHPTGSVGLYVWAHTSSEFDEVRVEAP